MDATDWLTALLKRMERTALVGGLLGAVGAVVAGWLAEWVLDDPLWFMAPPRWPVLMTVGGLVGIVGGLGLYHRRLNRFIRGGEHG